MKLIQSSIKKLDFLGPQINFTIKREPNFKSVLGGFVSLIVYCLYIFFFIYFGKDMIKKQNPNITFESLNPENQESLQLNNKTFFAWRLEDLSGNRSEIVELFNVYLKYFSYDNVNLDYLDIKLLSSVRCSKNEGLKSFFSNTSYNPDEWFCIDFAELEGKNLTGSFSDKIMSTVLFNLDICEFDFLNKKKSNCKDFRKMRKNLAEKDIYFASLFHEAVFRPNHYEAPLEQRLKKTISSINMNQMKSEMLYFQSTIVEQDDGILFDNAKEKANMISINRREEMANFRTDDILDEYYKTDEIRDNNVIYSLMFYYDQPYRKYVRKYMKLQDVFGNVNGFMEFVILIFSLINFYTNYRFDYFLLNELVKVKIDKSFSSNVKGESELRSINNKIKDDKDIGYSIPDDLDKVKSEPFSQSKRFNNHNSNKNFIGNLGNSDKEVTNSNKISVLTVKQQTEKIEEEANISGISAPANDSNTSRKLMINQKQENSLFNKFISDRNLSKEPSNQDDLQLREIVLIEADKKMITEKLEGLSFDLNNKKRYLEPNLFNYYCTSKNKKKAFDLKLLETYIDKINEKFDAFYYLNFLRQFKNLKKFLFREKNESTVFKLLSSNLYDLRIRDCNDELLNKQKNHKRIIQDWVNSLKYIREGNLSHFIINNIEE